MTVEDLEREFAGRGTLRGGVLLLSPHDARILVKRAYEESIRVLGVDGFHLTPSTTQPDMGHSLDLSSPIPDPWSTADAFITVHAPAVTHFEVVLGDLPHESKNVEAGRRFLAEAHALSGRLAARGVDLFDVQYDALAFGSWVITVGTRKRRVRFVYDGRDERLAASGATFPDSRSHPTWSDIDLPGPVGRSSLRELLHRVEHVAVRESVAQRHNTR